MNYPVKPREIYIVTPTANGTVTVAESGLLICSFAPGSQTWFQAPTDVSMVVISDDEALVTPVD